MRELCWVTFKTPNNTLANLVLINLIQALASNFVLKLPIDKKVSVCPIRGSPIRGVDKTSPKAPLPLASGTKTL